MATTSTIQVLSVADVPVSLPLEVRLSHSKVAQRMSLLALSHSAIEHRLYRAMLDETIGGRRSTGSFSVRRLLALSGLRSYGSIRRGCLGLISKLSIESLGQDSARRSSLYRVFTPDEIFARRRAAGMPPYPEEVSGYEGNRVFCRLIQHVVERHDLSRREALVALCCVEGLSNAEIGKRLQISEQTVKSHLRHIFDKFGVRRRTELVSRLLIQRGGSKNGNRGNRISNRGEKPRESLVNEDLRSTAS